jgi:hypothetical protein
LLRQPVAKSLPLDVFANKFASAKNQQMSISGHKRYCLPAKYLQDNQLSALQVFLTMLRRLP